MDLRRRFFDKAYRRGSTPWDSGITPPEVIVFADERDSPGRALDLGCGTGTNAIYLARRGWQVVGVDFSEIAIRAAREKLQRASLGTVIFLQGDVSELTAAGVTGSFDFILDIGCFHGLLMRKRGRYVRQVAAHARPGATLLMFAFGSSLHVPGRHPSREAAIRRRFGAAFEVVHIELGTEPLGAAWFTLRRRS